MCELHRILQFQCHLEAWEEDRRLPEQVGHGGCRAPPPQLVLPTGQPNAVDAWSRAELVDLRAWAVLKRMNADLRPSNLGAAKLTGATLLREFLEHRVAPLQEHSLPLWRLGEADVSLHLSSEALADEDLAAALHSLVGETWRARRALLSPCSFVMTGSRW